VLTRLLEFSLTQRLVIIAGMVALLVAGSFAYLGLPIDAFPDVSSTQVKIIVKAPGMTPEEVEARITAPIEIEMLGIPNKRIVRSTSKYAIADITIDFEDGTDIYWARQQVTERLNGVTRDLPAGVTGGLAPITTPLGEMLMFTIEGPGLSLAERRSILDWTLRPALRTLPGVAEINALGGEVRAFEVIPDNGAMRVRGVTVADLHRALESNNRNDGAGRIQDGEEALVVRVEGNVKTLDDIRAIVVSSREGLTVRVGDLAKVVLGSTTRYGAVSQNGQGEAVQGLVLGLRGANARQVVGDVKIKLAELAPSLPKGVQTRVFYDRGKLVGHAVGTVQKALGEAIVLVLILLVLFLGNLRAALVVATILPLSALATFGLMRMFNMSANLMSLGGLSIAIGMLVDAAVVVVENVMTHLATQNHAKATPDGKNPGLPRLHIIYRAVKEVATPVTSGILIIIIVFLPLMSLEGLEGKLFIPVALTIVFALSASLLLSLTAIPVLTSFMLKQVSHQEPWLVRMAQKAYLPSLKWSLAHPLPIALLAALALAGSGVVYSRLGKTFMPTMDEGDVIMQLEMLPSISLDQGTRINMAIQTALLSKVPEIERIVARSGSDELGLDPMGLNQTDTFMVLKERALWRRPDKAWLIDQMRSVMSNFPGVAITFTQPIDMRVSEMLTGVRGDVAIKVFGSDVTQLNHLTEKIAETLRGVRGAQDVLTLKNEGVQYYKVEFDRLAAGRFGVTVDELGTALKMQLEGQSLGLVLEPGRRTPLISRGEARIRTSVTGFSQLQLTLPNQQSVPLAALAKLTRVDGPVKVDRENAARLALIQTNVRDRDLVGFVEEARQRVLDKVPMPPGYRTVWGGQFENQQRAAARLALVVPASLIMIFALLFATFGSLAQATLVFANIPFAMIGGVISLWLFGEYISVPASVGFIALLGIAVLNGVVMVSHFNHLRDRGMPVEQLVIEGAQRRLRPVLMTASIAAFGLVPLLFASGPGSEIQRPLAIVVIGGLITSTLLTLIILPMLYRRFGVAGLPRKAPPAPDAARLANITPEENPS
jgi:heavy metal efflux system protein